MFLSAGTALAWTNLEGGDHGNTAWEASGDTTIAGRHWGITTFSVPSGSNLRFRSYSEGYGWASIHAQDISIQGTVWLYKEGYPGGAAGSGGGGQQLGGNMGSAGGTQIYDYS